MSAKKVTVAWECPECGTRHLWKWPSEDVLCASQGRIKIYCDRCRNSSGTELFRIGKKAFAALWPTA
jgi:ribosomal protein L44E